MDHTIVQELCPDCGTARSDEPWAMGLCLSCLARLASESPGLLAEMDEAGLAGDEQATQELSGDSLSPGRILGSRYQIRALLGRGGMGEVWRAFDLKLRVDVALKALRPQLLEHRRARETLRQEVRVARQVVSPNVCRVFDLVEIEGNELVSMEFIDGIALSDTLKLRAPLPVTEAREIAAQFLAGLEAIHGAGLVHRDVKPENVMTTRSGRVVVMDFGIARGLADRATGTVSGTPAYMAPEQARGEEVDARADIFSVGVVLAEMTAPRGVGSPEERAALWEGLRHEPPRVPETPWAPVVRKAVAPRSADRWASATELARALEEVTLRVDAGDDLHPYPGLAAFTREDAEYFFGRELEVEEMWKKLRRPHLMGLIGPSGAGKSSFLRAGLLPVMPTGWRAVVMAPGNRPTTALGQALVPELEGDPEVMEELLRFGEPDVAVSVVSRWRRRHEQVLIVVDQFEELFTQNPADVQSRFAELLARLALDADARVLLSMRDDFLFHCSSQPALAPMFSELTPLRPPSGAALRRALVQPALRCGYRFEEKSLVDTMVAEVSNERGALPMLAFAAARLWELRERERGLLTREAYEHIGGVGGALAQHAEATLERIGQERIPVVRELFRNLVTAQGTRAAREREELLSVFGGESAGGGTARAEAGEVLDALIAARLLTSYETAPAEDEVSGHHRVEIIHESLLSNWPRLVRWRAQEEDGALLRDQLRQAAQMWEERGRPEDLLWTGTSFKEYELWRERYGGGISSQEETFVAAMLSKAQRNRRRKRLLLAATIGALAIGLAVFGGLWRQAERAKGVAEAETRRAEASKVLMLARLELDSYPTGALAYATRSLELADTPEARRFALGILWRGPVARVLPGGAYEVLFSPDGENLALHGERVRLLADDGEVSEPFGRGRDIWPVALAFSERGDVLIRPFQRGQTKMVERWTIPGLEELPVVEWQGTATPQPATFRGLPIYRVVDAERGIYEASLLPSPPFPRTIPPEVKLGRLVGIGDTWFTDATGEWLLARRGAELWRYPFRAGELEHGLRLVVSPGRVRAYAYSPDGTRIASAVDGTDQLLVWSTDPRADGPELELLGNEDPDPLSWPHFSADNRKVVMASSAANAVYVWDLQVPLDRRPLVLRAEEAYGGVFHPRGRWLATAHGAGIALWPIDWPFARRISSAGDPQFSWIGRIGFSSDGRWIAACSNGSGLHMWPLDPTGGGERVVQNACVDMAFDPAAPRILMARQELEVAPLDDLEATRAVPLGGPWPAAVAFGPRGRYLAGAQGALRQDAKQRVVVWDLATDEVRDLDPLAGCPLEGEWNGTECRIRSLAFGVGGALWSGGQNGVRRWDSGTPEPEWLAGPDPRLSGTVAASLDGRFLLARVTERASEGALVRSEATWWNLEAGTHRSVELEGLGERATLALDPSGRVLAAGDDSGLVRVRRLSDGAWHELVGHDAPVYGVKFSPDGRWIASATNGEILLWPVPDLDRPPFHALPLDQLLSSLHSFTNVRAVEAPESESGWTLDLDPFPGWRDHPTW